MLQRIHDSSARWVAVILLGLVSVGFIFWRADFNNGRTATFAAKVNGENLLAPGVRSRAPIAPESLSAAISHRAQRGHASRVAAQPSSRTWSADAVLRQRVDEQGYRASDARVIEAHSRPNPAFQVDGQFSKPMYESLLATQGSFRGATSKSAQRNELEVRDLQEGIVESTFLTPAEFRRYIELFNQRREIGYGLFTRRCVSRPRHDRRGCDLRPLSEQPGSIPDDRDGRPRIRRALARRHRLVGRR